VLREIDAKTLGERLRRARLTAALTQQGAADTLGFARTTVVAIESGARRVGPDELRRFAEVYSTSTGRLLAADAVHVDLAAKFRKLETAGERTGVAEAIALLSRLATGAIELERSLGVSFTPDYPTPLKINPRQVLVQAEDAAVNLRQRLGLGLGRLPDPFEFLELDLGLRIFVRPLRDGAISGLYAYDPEVGACVLINGNHPALRRRQSLVHETGHFISDRSHADVLDEKVTPASVDERFARRFGPALLMPAPTVRARFEQIVNAVGELNVRELVLLARQFGVATEAMCRRLEDLELVANGTWGYLKDSGYSSKLEADVAGPQPKEPPPPLIPTRLSYLAAKALEDGVLSEGQLSEMLVVTRSELRKSMADFIGVGRLSNDF
jgi:Zn-dependent peptidase ImmA (M78 family)/DNA-binding XRE family transcriptional regulator